MPDMPDTATSTETAQCQRVVFQYLLKMCISMYTTRVRALARANAFITFKYALVGIGARVRAFIHTRSGMRARI